jgi:hypothetical protein
MQQQISSSRTIFCQRLFSQNRVVVKKVKLLGDHFFTAQANSRLIPFSYLIGGMHFQQRRIDRQFQKI